MIQRRFAAGCAVGLLCAAASIARGQDTGPPKPQTEAVQTTHFILHPAELSYAPMKYRLLPKYIEQTPGNAAPHYFRAMMVWGFNKSYQDAAEKISDWAELPLSNLRDNDQANDFLNNCPTYDFDAIRLAARREYCDWDLPFREQNIQTHIPELKKMRDLAWIIALKARMAMARGNLDEAVDYLKTGLQMARDAAKGPTLVNGLVGVAIGAVMLKQVETLIQQPNCPNLYWTLTALPDPLVDLRPAMEMEQDNLYLILPSLRDLRSKKLSEAEWNALLVDVVQKILAIVPKVVGEENTWAKTAVFAVTAYPKAKAELARAGYSGKQIDDMPMSQALLLAELEAFESTRDKIFKWSYIDFADATQGLETAEKEFADANKADTEIFPLAQLLMPALKAVRFAQVRLSREVAALRCVEALRMYAAQHEGKLPDRLNEIKEVPVPLDPNTGKAFAYEHSGLSAVVSSASPPGYGTAEHALRWQISIAAKK